MNAYEARFGYVWRDGVAIPMKIVGRSIFGNRLRVEDAYGKVEMIDRHDFHYSAEIVPSYERCSAAHKARCDKLVEAARAAGYDTRDPGEAEYLLGATYPEVLAVIN